MSPAYNCRQYNQKESNMASGIYTLFKKNLMTAQCDLDTGGDTIYVALYDGSHAFAAGDSAYTTDNELAVGTTGYTQGADATNLLVNPSITAATTTKWDADDTAWTTATFSAYHAVIWDSSTTNSLICSIDMGGAQTVSAGTFTIIWDAAGIITLAS